MNHREEKHQKRFERAVVTVFDLIRDYPRNSETITVVKEEIAAFYRYVDGNAFLNTLNTYPDKYVILAIMNKYPDLINERDIARETQKKLNTFMKVLFRKIFMTDKPHLISPQMIRLFQEHIAGMKSSESKDKQRPEVIMVPVGYEEEKEGVYISPIPKRTGVY